MTKVTVALTKVKTAFSQVNKLYVDVTKERAEQMKAFIEALRAGRDTDVEPILERFEAFSSYSHYYGNAVVFVKLAIDMLNQKELPPEETAVQYDRIVKVNADIEKKFIRSIGVLLDEIKEHPEYIKPGEEPIIQRIMQSLEKQVQSTAELVAAIKELESALPKKVRRGKAGLS